MIFRKSRGKGLGEDSERERVSEGVLEMRGIEMDG